MNSDDRPKVVVVMPRYGAIESRAARGFYHASRGVVNVRNIIDVSNSLTPNAFNDLLNVALDLRDAGQADLLAMIHSDIEPESYWVDDLWAEMSAHQADLMSAVIPIKIDVPNPPTSTAIGDANDPWTVLRHIHVDDRERMSETFGQEICGPDEVLLVNTGLWLTDLRCSAWDDFPGFRIVTEITRNVKGKRIARCRSEDWEMSRHLHAAGAKVMATWRVPLGHRGTKVWKNYTQGET